MAASFAPSRPAQAPASSPSRSRKMAISAKFSRGANRDSRFFTTSDSGFFGSQRTAEEAVPSDTLGDFLGVKALEEREGTEVEGWYEEHVPCGGLDVQPYATGLPYFSSYSRAALDWDSLKTSSLFTGPFRGTLAALPTLTKPSGKPVALTPPRRVLDIGCGPTPFWILAMATQPGWEKTEFVGLDAAPTRLADNMLSSSIVGRLSYVQRDFFGGLPFDDNAFDYVHIQYLNLGLPEPEWATLLEEAVRVLAPGCFIEVLESDFVVYRKPATPRPSHDRAPSLSGDEDLYSIESMFEAVLDDRFINPRPLSIIPSNLALVAHNLRSTGRISIELPANPPHPSDDKPDSKQSPFVNSHMESLRPALNKYTTWTDTPVAYLRSNEARIQLHGFAEKWASSSRGLARAALEIRNRRARQRSRSSERGPRPSELKIDKDLQDLEDVIDGWADDLKERAGLAQLVRSQFGWEPTMDQKMVQALEANLPILDERLHGFGIERQNHENVFGEPDPEIEFRFQQMEFAKRECEIDLRAVKRRLEGPERDEECRVLGVMDTELFVAHAP
ncbi:hypothetical protein JCM1841_002676 [Sporobolomyces salmonicolor]